MPPPAPLALASAEAKSGAAVLAIAFALLGAEENHPPCRRGVTPSRPSKSPLPPAAGRESSQAKRLVGDVMAVRSLDVANEAHRDKIAGLLGTLSSKVYTRHRSRDDRRRLEGRFHASAAPAKRSCSSVGPFILLSRQHKSV